MIIHSILRFTAVIGVLISSIDSYPCNVDLNNPGGECESNQELFSLRNEINGEEIRLMQTSENVVPPCNKSYSYNYPVEQDTTCQLYFHCENGKLSEQSCSPNFYDAFHYFDRNSMKCVLYIHIWKLLTYGIEPNCTGQAPMPTPIPPTTTPNPSQTTVSPDTSSTKNTSASSSETPVTSTTVGPTFYFNGGLTLFLATLGGITYYIYEQPRSVYAPPQCDFTGQMVVASDSCKYYYECTDAGPKLNKCWIFMRFSPDDQTCKISFPFREIECRSSSQVTTKPPTTSNPTKPSTDPSHTTKNSVTTSGTTTTAKVTTAKHSSSTDIKASSTTVLGLSLTLLIGHLLNYYLV